MFCNGLKLTKPGFLAFATCISFYNLLGINMYLENQISNSEYS